MLKSSRKRRQECSLRIASATSPRRSPRRRYSALIVEPSMKPSTSAPSSGRYATTPAPTPASAAATELTYSFSRSIASSPPPFDDDLVVRVRETAWQLGDDAVAAGQLLDAGQDVVDRHVLVTHGASRVCRRPRIRATVRF